jgi:hypothetical protein
MLDVKEAAQKASEYFASLYSQDLASNVRLEEVELTDDGNYWLITLGYPSSRTQGNAFQFLTGNDTGREYKQFKIEVATGKVVSMKIRKV